MSEALTFEMRAPVDGLKADLQQAVQAARVAAAQMSAQRISLKAQIDQAALQKDIAAVRIAPVKVKAELDTSGLTASRGGGGSSASGADNTIQMAATLAVIAKASQVVAGVGEAFKSVYVEGMSAEQATLNFAKALPIIGGIFKGLSDMWDAAGVSSGQLMSKQEINAIREGTASNIKDASGAGSVRRATRRIGDEIELAGIEDESTRKAMAIRLKAKGDVEDINARMGQGFNGIGAEEKEALRQQAFEVERKAEVELEALKKSEQEKQKKKEVEDQAREAERQTKADDVARAENERANEDRYERDTRWAEKAMDEQDRAEKEAMRAEEKRNEESRDGLAKWNEQFEVDGGNRGRGGSSEAVSASTTSFAVEGSTMIGIQREGNSFLKKMAAHLEQIEKNKVKVF